MDRKTPWILLPFVMIWRFVELILNIVGRAAIVVIGFVVMIVGIVFCISVVGVMVGMPLTAFGFVLMLRGFF
ncbi:MAG: hypothetical protein H7Y41_06565 [Hyphomonadaceae bacterium]|nr:hypothetical protein [Clostridia bacterium]